MPNIILYLWLLLLEQATPYQVKIPHKQKEFKQEDNEERLNTCREKIYMGNKTKHKKQKTNRRQGQEQHMEVVKKK